MQADIFFLKIGVEGELMVISNQMKIRRCLYLKHPHFYTLKNKPWFPNIVSCFNFTTHSTVKIDPVRIQVLHAGLHLTKKCSNIWCIDVNTHTHILHINVQIPWAWRHKQSEDWLLIQRVNRSTGTFLLEKKIWWCQSQCCNKN